MSGGVIAVGKNLQALLHSKTTLLFCVLCVLSRPAPAFGLIRFASHRNHVFARAEEQRPVRHCRSGHEGFAQLVRGGDGEFFAGANHVHVLHLAGEVEMAAVRNGRSRESLAAGSVLPAQAEVEAGGRQ